MPRAEPREAGSSRHVLLAALMFLAGPSAGMAAELGLGGGDEILWVYQTRLDASAAAKQLYLAFMPMERTPLRFRPLNQVELGGEVVRAAVRGRRLHAFFRDGTHIRLEPEARRVAGPQAVFWELKLPEGAVPLALAGDAGKDVLYAVVPGRVAEEVDLADAAEDPGPTTQAEDEGPARTSGRLELRPAPEARESMPTQPAIRPVLSRYCLVRYERGRWRRDREVPAAFDRQTACLLAAEQDALDLFFQSPDAGGSVWLIRCEQDRWTTAERLEAVRTWDDLRACARRDGRSFILVESSKGMELLSRVGNEAWDAKPLVSAPEAAISSASAAALAGDVVALAWEAEGDAVHAAFWDTAGQPKLAPQPVEALLPPEGAEGLETFREIAPFVVLGLSLVYVFARRRESVIFPAQIKADQRPARYSRRLAAFVLDLVVVAPVAVPTLYGWARHFESDTDVLISAQVAASEYYVELFWRWFVALGVLVVYGIGFEALRGGTPGKLLMGCRVVTEKGERCGLRAVVLRNLLRLLELFPMFDFAPLLLLVFLTRNRQRLGDLVARSIVVERRAAEPPKFSQTA